MELVLKVRSLDDIQIKMFLEEVKKKTELIVRVKSNSALLKEDDNDNNSSSGTKEGGSDDGSSSFVYLLIGAVSNDVYCKLAEECRLRKRTVKGKWICFDKSVKKEFITSCEDDDMTAAAVPFTSGEKIDMILYKLRTLRASSVNEEETIDNVARTGDHNDTTNDSEYQMIQTGDFLFQKALQSQRIAAVFGLHNEAERKHLMESWVKHVGVTQPFSLPITEIRDYCGNEVGFYFAFLGLYTDWLVYPSMAGLAVYMYQV